jgi:RNase adapter protein RapZ
MIFDCRFLRNPHWEPALRAMDGRDAAVVQHLQSDARYAEFHQKVIDLLLFLLPAHLAEGKAHLAIGFGCTGGQHRSVAVAEIVGNVLAEAGWPVSRRHRELERRDAATGAAPEPTRKNGP